MDVQELLYRRFIAPMESRQTLVNRIGIEIEYPLVCLGSEGNKVVVKDFFSSLIKQGFIPLYNGRQEMVGVKKKFVARISLDSSYNNLEIGFSPVVGIGEVDHIFRELIKLIRQIFAERALLIDSGVHPLIYSLPANFLDDDELVATRKFLEKYAPPNFYGRADFFAFISSIQTHLEFTPHELPYALTVLSKLDFAEILLFANSPLKTREGWFRCSRYYYYTRSALSVAGLTGSLDKQFHTVQDILSDYAQRCLYFRWRENCQFFSPVALKDYFRKIEYEAQAEDINCFYSYKNTELKLDGIVERRIHCTQPFHHTFAPAAFARGMAAKLGQADELVKRFLRDNQITDSNSQRCEMAARGMLIGSKDSLYALLGGLWQLALDSALMRGVGDEAYLTCFDEKFSALMNWYENKIMNK